MSSPAVDIDTFTGFFGEDSAAAVKPDLPDLQAIAREKYTMEWGVRESDGSLVLHFFPPLANDTIASEWDYDMDKRLDVAIPQVFDVSGVNAGFETTYNSFYIIVRGIIAPDLRLLVQRFLELIEGATIPPAR